MLKRITAKIILFTLLSGLVSYSLKGENYRDTNSVYIISSFSYSNEWGQILAKKIKKDLESSLNLNNITIIYSGVDKADTPEQAMELLNPEIWKDSNPELLIVIGYEAWMTLRSFDDTLLKKTPVIICGIERQEFPDYKYYLNNKNISASYMVSTDSLLSGYNAAAVPVKDYSENTIAEISRLLPQVRNIVYISEQSYTDHIYIERFEEIINSKYPSLYFGVIKTPFVTEEFLNSLRLKIDANNTALIINNFNIRENPDKSPWDTDVLEAPVFLLRYKDLDNTHSIVGGVFEPVNIYASKVVSAAGNILAGKKPEQEREVRGESPNFVNKAAAMKFNIKLKDLQGLFLVNESGSDTRKLVITAAGIILIALMFIFTVITAIRVLGKRRRILKETREYSDTVKNYGAVYTNIPVGIAAFNEDGTFCEGNAEFMRIIRIIIPDFRHTNKFNLFISGLITDDIREAADKSGIAEKTISVENNNSEFVARLIFTPCDTRNGKSIIICIFDITQTLLERKKRDYINTIFDKALGESRLGVAELDIAKKRYEATDGWYKGLNISRNTSFRECFDNLEHNDKEKIIDFIENAVKEGEVQKKMTAEIKILQNDSAYHWAKIMLRIKERDIEKNRIICSAILIDIDSHKQKEENLKEIYTRIIQSNMTKNSFLSNMSNDIRMPLNAIVGFSELIIESTDAAEQKELVKYLNENNEKFLKLISDIVDISKIESGTMKSAMGDVDINKMMKELIKTAEPHIDARKIKIVFNPKEHCIVYSDKDRLQQVVANFLSNAVKFTKEGYIELGYRLLSKKIQLYVKDTGCGVEPDKRKHLFDRFSKNNNDYTSCGIGLSIASSIIKFLKGEIGFESEIGKGSTFWCTIPSEYVGTDTQIGLTGKLESATMHMGGNLKTILVAEDNENNFQLLNFILKGKFKIIHAINGEKAVELFREHNPDIILMDIKMPVMDGYQAAAVIRQISAEVPIIAVTAYAFSNDKEKILDSSFNRFISKPVREKELMETINGIFNK